MATTITTTALVLGGAAFLSKYSETEKLAQNTAKRRLQIGQCTTNVTMILPTLTDMICEQQKVAPQTSNQALDFRRDDMMGLRKNQHLTATDIGR